MSERKLYIGDGVYADITDNQLILTTENGLRVTNTIVFDDPTLQQLLQYLQRHTKIVVQWPR